MNAFTDMAAALGRAQPVAPTVKGRTARMRQLLAEHGPLAARELVTLAGLSGSGTVGALLKHDIKSGRVVHSGGLYTLSNAANAVGPLRQSITWIPIDEQLPDADTTVLVATSGCSEPVWLGYYGDGEWFDAEDARIQVTHWAHPPQSPNPA